MTTVFNKARKARNVKIKNVGKGPVFSAPAKCQYAAHYVSLSLEGCMDFS